MPNTVLRVVCMFYVRVLVCNVEMCINSDTKCLVMCSVKCVNDKRVIHLIVIYAHCLAASNHCTLGNAMCTEWSVQYTHTMLLSALNVTPNAINAAAINPARTRHHNNSSIEPIISRWQLRYLVRHVVLHTKNIFICVYLGWWRRQRFFFHSFQFIPTHSLIAMNVTEANKDMNLVIIEMGRAERKNVRVSHTAYNKYFPCDFAQSNYVKHTFCICI